MAARLTAPTNGTTFATGFSPPPGDRPASTARGVHHQALLCSDVEQTINFYSRAFWLSLTELFENRDYAGSTHFFDIGNGNCLAFFDMPGLGLGDYQEVLRGHHHLPFR